MRGLRSCSSWARLQSTASVVVVTGFVAPRGVFPDQGWNQHFLHWRANSLPLSHQGSPACIFFRVLLSTSLNRLLPRSSCLRKWSSWDRLLPFTSRLVRLTQQARVALVSMLSLLCDNIPGWDSPTLIYLSSHRPSNVLVFVSCKPSQSSILHTAREPRSRIHFLYAWERDCWVVVYEHLLTRLVTAKLFSKVVVQMMVLKYKLDHVTSLLETLK